MFRFSDVFKKIRNSTIGDFKIKSTLGGVELEVISSKTETTKISSTNRRTEKGFNISDSSRSECLLINITVVDNSFDYLVNRASLKKIANSGEYTEFNFAGRDYYKNVIITDIKEVESSGQANGLTYDISLKIIKTAEIEITEKVEYKKAEISGGSKISKTAEIKTPTEKEEKTSKTILKSAIDGFGGLLGGKK